MSAPRVYLTVSGRSLALHCSDELVIVNAKLVVERALRDELGVAVAFVREGLATFVTLELSEEQHRKLGGLAAAIVLVVARAMSVAGAVLESSGVAMAENVKERAEVCAPRIVAAPRARADGAIRRAAHLWGLFRVFCELPCPTRLKPGCVRRGRPSRAKPP